MSLLTREVQTARLHTALFGKDGEDALLSPLVAQVASAQTFELPNRNRSNIQLENRQTFKLKYSFCMLMKDFLKNNLIHLFQGEI